MPKLKKVASSTPVSITTTPAAHQSGARVPVAVPAAQKERMHIPL